MTLMVRNLEPTLIMLSAGDTTQFAAAPKFLEYGGGLV
jgi:hypothetical protein